MQIENIVITKWLNKIKLVKVTPSKAYVVDNGFVLGTPFNLNGNSSQ